MDTLILVPWLLSFVMAHGVGLPKCTEVRPPLRVPADACTEEQLKDRADILDVRREAVDDALEVAFDPAEAPLYPGRHGREFAALEILAIATHESGLQPRLWRNECLEGECDGGAATGELQLHLGDYGLKLVGPRWLKACTECQEGCITRDAVLADHAKGFRVALHILRAGGLALYTGGPRSGPAPAWIEDVMRDFLAATRPSWTMPALD